MALTRTESQIVWSAANSVTISDNTMWTHISDALSFDATDISAVLQLQVTRTGGSDTTGDTMDVFAIYSVGDVTNGGGSNVYDSAEHAQFLGRVSCYTGDTPGENPAIKTFPILSSAKAFKLLLNWNSASAATRTAVCYARVITQRAA